MFSDSGSSINIPQTQRVLSLKRARAPPSHPSGPCHIPSTRHTISLMDQERQLCTHLTLQFKRGGIRVRSLRTQGVRQLLRGHEHCIAVAVRAYRHDSLVEVWRRVRRRGDARSVVVDARVDEHTSRAGCALRRRREVVDAPRLNVDRRNLRGVVRRENGQLDRTTPGARLQYCADVLFSGTAAAECQEVLCIGERNTYPRIASLHVSGSLRIASATTGGGHDGYQRCTMDTTNMLTLANQRRFADVLLKHERNRVEQTRIVVRHDLVSDPTSINNANDENRRTPSVAIPPPYAQEIRHPFAPHPGLQSRPSRFAVQQGRALAMQSTPSWLPAGCAQVPSAASPFVPQACASL